MTLRFAALSAYGFVAAAQIIAGNEAPRRACPSTQRASKVADTLRADLRPTVASRSVAQPPEISGEASRWPILESAASLALAPAQLARCLERREKGISMLLGGFAGLRCAGTRLSARFAAALREEERESFVSGFLERAPAFEDGCMRIALYPELDGYPPVFALTLTVPALPLANLRGGIER